jgi:hypothetical protein
MEPLREEWRKEIGRKPLPWYAEMKREQGAFATFLGIALRRPDHWRAVAVGDSCLFQVRGAETVTSFPLKSSAEFGNHPALIGSQSKPGVDVKPTLKQLTGRWQPGDHFLLMTDALAQWYLREHEQDRRPWELLEPVLAAEDPAAVFAALVVELRDRGDLKNDDVTLLLAESSSAKPSRNASSQQE